MNRIRAASESLTVVRRGEKGRVGTRSLFAILAVLGLSGVSAASAQDRWVAAWTFPPFSVVGPVTTPAPSPAPPASNDIRGPAGPDSVADRTLRQNISVSAGGSAVRLRLSNIYGAVPLRIGAISVSTADGAPLPVTFDGSRAVSIPAGAPRLSDPVPVSLRPGDSLTVSVFYPEQTTLPHHRVRMVVQDGDMTASPSPMDARPLRMGGPVTAVEVRTEAPVDVLVAFGDSITEGVSASPSGAGGWPERLARRMRTADRPWAVVNGGIGGNRLLHRGSGPSGLERLDSDALAVPGARCLILLEGINDLGRPARAEFAHEAITADDLISGYRQVIARAHAAGLKTVIATLPPFHGFSYFSEVGEAIRQSTNVWIRTSGEPDAVIDFDAAIRDPNDARSLLEAYDSGDGLHPSDAGYQAMADVIPLSACDAGPGADSLSD